MGLWLQAVRQIDVLQMTDLGMVSVLPWTGFLALFLLNAAFFVALYRRQLDERVVAALVILLIFMLHGITALVENSRFAVAWLHVGFIEYIQRTGQVNPLFDARMS